MTRLVGWGRFPIRESRLIEAASEDEIRAALKEGPLIARGMGRAYGDAAQAPRVLEMKSHDRFIAFDPQTGILEAEAGLTLGAIIEAFLPRGWFPAVTPGTQHVSLGGAIASDVHGKNHHVDGSFESCTEWFDLMGPDGEVRRCSRMDNSETFARTFGGMGLTGVILRAGIRLRKVESGWIRQQLLPAANLTEALAGFEATLDAPYSVAWIDALATGEALGRSLLMTGHHAARHELPVKYRARPFATPAPRRLALPFDLPGFTLNRLSLKAFNALYYWNGARKAGESFVAWRPYFYPLDAISGWNRMYGRKGFVQFQCALPLDSSEAGLRALLTRISASGSGSFLAVLKRFGAGKGPNSFPMEGYTLALDFPASAANLRLLDELDRITLDHGGRFYLAKDARMSAETLRLTDPRMAGFHQWRRAEGLDRAFASDQSQRLGL